MDDRHPIVNTNMTLQHMGNRRIITSLDLRQGYHHVPLEKESQPLTAFSTQYGIFEFTTVLFELKQH